MGHQDKNKQLDHPFTIPEKINIDCNARASHMPPPPDDIDSYHNPLIPAGYPHIQINQCLCKQWVQHTLRDAATNSTYFDYLSGKFCGIPHPATDIHWHLLRNLLKWCKSTEQCMLTKFIHEWLPLQDCHQTQSLSCNQHCPSCHQATRTIEHVLACVVAQGQLAHHVT